MRRGTAIFLAAGFFTSVGQASEPRGKSVFTSPADQYYSRAERRVGVPVEKVPDPAILSGRPLAWRRLEEETGRRWNVLWDAASGVPRLAYIHGEGLVLIEPRLLQGMSVAAQREAVVAAARNFLERYREAFGLENQEIGPVRGRVRRVDGRLWVADFEQRHGEIPIRGSSLSLRIKDGTLLQIQSHVYPQEPCEGGCPELTLSAFSEEHVLYPVRTPEGRYALRLARKEKGWRGKTGSVWTTYRDLLTNRVLDRWLSTYRFSGRLLGAVYDRGPTDLDGTDVSPVLRPFTNHRILLPGLVWLKTDDAGEFAGTVATPVERVVVPMEGKYSRAALCEYAGGARDHNRSVCKIRRINFTPRESRVSIALVDEKPPTAAAGFLFSSAASPAERNVLYHVNRLRQAVARHVQSSWLERPVVATVNNEAAGAPDEEGGPCNATYDGSQLYFFREGTVVRSGQSYTCSNTGTVSDIIHHEYCHGLYDSFLANRHAQEDPAMSEATGDVCAFHMSGDSRIGLGVFRETFTPATGNFMRDAAGRRKDGTPLRYPDDIPLDRQPHLEGRIAAGAIWDLRRALVRQYGSERGNDLSFGLFLRALQVSQIYTELYDALLVVDDDDNNLLTPSPHQHAIASAFAARCLAHPGQNAPYCRF